MIKSNIKKIGFMQQLLSQKISVFFVIGFLGIGLTHSKSAFCDPKSSAQTEEESVSSDKLSKKPVETPSQETPTETSKDNRAQNSTSNNSPKNLDELLKKIKEDQISNRLELKKREQLFLQTRNKQKALLKKAKSELLEQERLLSQLQSEFEKQDQELSQLEENLALTMGVLGELFGVVRQTAGETKALFQNSIISAQYPKRSQFIESISQKKNLPSSKDLETLWFLIQQEMTESGKITRFKQNIIQGDGKTKEQEIIRVATFNLVSNGKYLVFDNETQRILELTKQPKRRFLSLAKKLQKGTKDKLYKFGVDPSRGSLLSLLIQSPSLFERVNQGGFIGYFILLLFVCGLALSLKKYLYLKEYQQLVQAQIQSDSVLKDNPLGDLLQTFLDFKNEKQETLELKMEEAILQKSSPIKSGLGTIKLLSSTAPLLGLLGTVTGMISTFQSITLFGTGDPKLMAGGISQALVTTALGLLVAIPLVFIYSFLSNKANSLIQIFEEQAIGILSKKSPPKNNRS